MATSEICADGDPESSTEVTPRLRYATPRQMTEEGKRTHNEREKRGMMDVQTDGEETGRVGQQEYMEKAGTDSRRRGEEETTQESEEEGGKRR